MFFFVPGILVVSVLLNLNMNKFFQKVLGLGNAAPVNAVPAAALGNGAAPSGDQEEVKIHAPRSNLGNIMGDVRDKASVRGRRR